MRRVRYAVAMSLDGYVAGPNASMTGLRWIPDETKSFFTTFFAQFDTAVMGRRSFEEYTLSHSRPGRR